MSDSVKKWEEYKETQGYKDALNSLISDTEEYRNCQNGLDIEPIDKAQLRKNTPVFSGVLDYFPDGVIALARCSFAGQQQHAPDEPLQWHREKSGDELDALARHLLQAGTIDDDGIRHSAKVAWRAMANLQKELELNGEAPLSKYNKINK